MSTSVPWLVSTRTPLILLNIKRRWTRNSPGAHPQKTMRPRLSLKATEGRFSYFTCTNSYPEVKIDPVDHRARVCWKYKRSSKSGQYISLLTNEILREWVTKQTFHSDAVDFPARVIVNFLLQTKTLLSDIPWELLNQLVRFLVVQLTT